MLFCGDNLKIMSGMDGDSVDLIYLDPPFNTRRVFGDFSDIWTGDDGTEGLDDTLVEICELAGRVHSAGIKAYLLMMTSRLTEMHRILKPTGSIYLHCDPTASHYLKLSMDSVFGQQNFRNEVIWQYRTGGISKNHFARKHDSILFYCKTKKGSFSLPREESRDIRRFNKTSEDGRKYYEKAGNRYYADHGVAVTDVWDIPPVRNVSKERTGYPTQKPLALLDRIIKASSNEGDVVLDPFCGSGTSLVAAHQLGREHIGIDINHEAVEIAESRLAQKMLF